MIIGKYTSTLFLKIECLDILQMDKILHYFFLLILKKS